MDRNHSIVFTLGLSTKIEQLRRELILTESSHITAKENFNENLIPLNRLRQLSKYKSEAMYL